LNISEISNNPNCGPSDEFVFFELEKPRLIRGIRVNERGGDTDCEVVGVDGPSDFCPAFAVKITDSGAGFAYLIFGGAWGIRLRPKAYGHEPWDLLNRHQWGEPFKIYGKEEDILYR